MSATAAAAPAAAPTATHTGPHAVGFRTLPIPAELAARARAEGRSPQYGHPAHRERAAGYGPCRLCLDTFVVGEEDRLLFTYDPFAGLDPYPAPGPVFVHADGCEAFDAPDGFPDALRPLPLTLEAYGAGRWPVARERVEGGDVEGAAGRLFAHPAVLYVHVRNSEAGCYIARLERVGVGVGVR
jgi:hypothetical protein